MRHRLANIAAAALLLAFGVVVSADAANSPGTVHLGPALPSSAPGVGHVPGGPLVSTNIPGDPLPPSPVHSTMLGTEEFHVYAVTLSPGQVLHASVTTAADRRVAYELYGYGPSSSDVYSSGVRTHSYATSQKDAEIFLAADGSVSATCYVAIYDMASIMLEEDNPYTLTWEILERSPAPITRLGGDTRYDVAERAANASFGDYSGVTDILIASGADAAMADPISAAGLAGAYDAPLMLVQPTLINGHTNVQTERAINSIRSANGGSVNIHVIGGERWIPTAVYGRLSSLKGAGGTIERIGGANRYEVSLNMARRADQVLRSKGVTGGVPFVMVAAGDNSAAFFDALAAAPISMYNRAPTILARKTGLASTSAINAFKPGGTFYDKEVWLVNGPTYLSNTLESQTQTWQRLAGEPGTDHYAASVDILETARVLRMLDNIDAAVVARLPDALTGGVALGRLGAPIYYTHPTSLDTYARARLRLDRGGLEGVYVLGGTGSVSSSVASSMAEAVRFPLP